MLQACDLAGQRGERALFEHLELTLEPGAVVWLRGRNGRGKTSLLRLLAGLSTPMAGEVLVRRRAAAAGRTGVAPSACVYIGHANALKDDLTRRSRRCASWPAHAATGPTTRHDRAGAAAAGRARQPRTPRCARSARASVGASALARLALCLQPPSLWLLDEPFDALDADGIRRSTACSANTPRAAARRC